jgi:hypothetical protein
VTDDEDSFDESPTPERDRRRGRMMTSDDRALIGRRKQSYPVGVPVQRADDAPTNPLAVFDADLDPAEWQYVERLKRGADDPHVVTYKLAKALRKLVKDGESGGGVRDQLATAIAEQDKTLAELQRKAKFATRVAGGAITLALAAGGGLVGKIWDRAGDERELKVRAEYNEIRLKRIESFFEPATRGWPVSPASMQKDPSP